ncbi:TcpD family membrane protein [Leuconostoc pseudomesenteroides]|uniref:TcpD family membrane protein n=1 Tax=Leuconostoc pseudomesenteroides TaxID=33968 RepID=UPI0028989E78|nr:TcpD family membrane protein [Leuconostoc pseudomesenteroides]
MDFYNSIKPLLLVGTVVIAGWRVIVCYGKSETKDMWMAILIGGVIYFFVNGPANSLQAFSGILNALLNWVKGIGG